ncbi:hypothetical protein [Magnetovibrio sp.]|uniref:hypothetical protein n=1 Tax=Magnetovibrio sp. TaxID=2024836 RepID=UPI002F95308B
MPILVRFLLIHAAIGFGLAFVFVSVLVALDTGGLRTLMMSSDVGFVAFFLLVFLNGLTFGSVQIGVAVMLLGEEDGDRRGGGRSQWDRAWNQVRQWLAPPPKRVAVPIPSKRRR